MTMILIRNANDNVSDAFSELAVKINTYNAHVDVSYFVLIIFYRVLEL